MKTCRQCNAALDDEEAVCPQCGFRVNKPASGFFNWLLGRGPKSALDYLTLGNDYLNRRSPDGNFNKADLNRAIAAYTKAIRLDPKLAADYHRKLALAYQYRGEFYSKTNDFDRAIKDYTEAVRLFPYAVPYYYRAVAYFQKRRVDEAIADCNEAIRLQPDYYPAAYSRPAT
jgi:tetratricopeptide (TPR) repeat protein